MRGWCACIAVVAGLTVGRAWAATGERLMLNQATEAELASLPGIGADVAARIVALRTARGHFGSIEELRILPDASDAVLASLRDHTWVDVELPLGERKAYGSAADVLAEFSSEPSITEVQTWAASYAQVQPSTVSKWLAASRGFAALPQVRFEYRIKDDFGNDFEYFTPSGPVATSTDADLASAVQTDADVGQDRTILVRATWDLDQLVMSSEQIRVINEAQDVVKLREKVLGEVTRLYFERRRLQVDVLLAPKLDLMGQVRDELRLAELTAALDAYTGGRFSGSLP